MYWLSQRIPTDQFLLFGFDTDATEPDSLQELLIRRAERITDLQVRLRDVPLGVDYPYWVARKVGADQFVDHVLSDTTWPGLVAALGELLTEQLDVRVSPWRVHIFRGITGAPRCDGSTALIAVLQLSHALADGRRSTDIARRLFDSNELASPSTPDQRNVPGIALTVRGIIRLPVLVAGTFVRGFAAYRAAKKLASLTASGEIPPENPGQQLTSLDVPPGDRRVVRMIVVSADELRAPNSTVTVAVLTAIASALPRYLALTQQRLGAEVTMASRRESEARNNFRNVGIDLHTDEPDLRVRARKIRDALEQRSIRTEHPLMSAQAEVNRGLPAPMVRYEVEHWPLFDTPPSVIGNTVVSSVNRGADDLRLAGGQVTFTAGFPALSPSMSLTHGVHGIGDALTISILTSPDVMPDIDRYEALLREALGEVIEANGRAASTV
ncbi:wax ester/triacylglycerol synthase domain-containing protein [Antrihabitans stalactiti]|uniref:DUF1298 domain-containing protein n=1 Tax=Antrihabitans stalactiti TaxID=2584121 RepID=A0A848KH41_9NOCA|nr:wax ester/triacylglycerol synthase domain-containing protein [Antrihabitans stalactiti]NMN97599.1 DUF1298 domain-containing protein [Antrihabitans stalactiti]